MNDQLFIKPKLMKMILKGGNEIVLYKMSVVGSDTLLYYLYLVHRTNCCHRYMLFSVTESQLLIEWYKVIV
jgi:hypothetical protein